MAEKYDYGFLEDQLIELFLAGAPNFKKAEELIAKGADLNAAPVDPDNYFKNILSEIICNYDSSQGIDNLPVCDDCSNTHCRSCEHNKNPDLEESIIQVIKFFLSHGFDVNKSNGRFGAECLESLVFTRYLESRTVEAARLLFDAGARDIGSDDEDDECAPWDAVETENSCQRCCNNNYHYANILEAFSQMFLAIEENRPYQGIDSYEAAIGKKITRVLALDSERKDVFYHLFSATSNRQNCYKAKLYFVLGDGSSLIATENTELWVDTYIPSPPFIDVSENFKDIVGKTIAKISFYNSLVYTRGSRYNIPTINVTMDNGTTLRLTNNFGEHGAEDYAAYYSIEKQSNTKKNKFEIEIIEGHGQSSYFWFRPVILKEEGKIDWQDVVELDDEFSIEEGNIECFLYYFLNKHFDDSLTYNKRRYDINDGYIHGFEWDLTYNFFTYDTLKDMINDISQTAQMLENDYYNPRLRDVKKLFSIFYMCSCDDEDYINRNINNIHKHISIVTDFYCRFTRRLEKMMKDNPDTNVISIKGP